MKLGNRKIFHYILLSVSIVIVFALLTYRTSSCCIYLSSEDVAKLEKQSLSRDFVASEKIAFYYELKGDSKRRLFWYRKAAAQGSLPAKLIIYDTFYFGYDQSVSREEALSQLGDASKAGCPVAQKELAQFLEQSGGRSNSDNVNSLSLYKMAAYGGDREAAMLYGILAYKKETISLSEFYAWIDISRIGILVGTVADKEISKEAESAVRGRRLSIVEENERKNIFENLSSAIKLESTKRKSVRCNIPQ